MSNEPQVGLHLNSDGINRAIDVVSTMLANRRRLSIPENSPVLDALNTLTISGEDEGIELGQPLTQDQRSKVRSMVIKTLHKDALSLVSSELEPIREGLSSVIIENTNLVERCILPQINHVSEKVTEELTKFKIRTFLSTIDYIVVDEGETPENVKELVDAYMSKIVPDRSYATIYNVTLSQIERWFDGKGSDISEVIKSPGEREISRVLEKSNKMYNLAVRELVETYSWSTVKALIFVLHDIVSEMEVSEYQDSSELAIQMREVLMYWVWVLVGMYKYYNSLVERGVIIIDSPIVSEKLGELIANYPKTLSPESLEIRIVAKGIRNSSVKLYDFIDIMVGYYAMNKTLEGLTVSIMEAKKEMYVQSAIRLYSQLSSARKTSGLQYIVGVVQREVSSLVKDRRFHDPKYDEIDYGSELDYMVVSERIGKFLHIDPNPTIHLDDFLGELICIGRYKSGFALELVRNYSATSVDGKSGIGDGSPDNTNKSEEVLVSNINTATGIVLGDLFTIVL